LKHCRRSIRRIVGAASGGEVAVVQVGNILAQCPACGETRFRRRKGATDGDDERSLVYTCVNCGNKSTRLELVNQIGDEAVRRAARAFDSLRKKKRRRKKSPGA